MIDEGEQPQPHSNGQQIIVSSGKFVALEKIVRQFVVAEERKIVIFSGFDKALDLVEDLLISCLDSHGSDVRFLRLDGRTSSGWRNLNVHLFNTDDRYKIFLISIRAGGEGLNLTSSSTVVFLDQDWNPQVTKQAAARVHRIGQTKPVTIFKLNSVGTVEEQMQPRIAKKAYLAATVSENTHNSVSFDDTADIVESDEELLSSILHESTTQLYDQEISTQDMHRWDWFKFLEVTQGQAAMQVPNLNGEADKKSWLDRVERIKTDVFDGKKVDTRTRSYNVYQEEAKVELARADRRIGKSRTVEIDGFQISKYSLSRSPEEMVVSSGSRREQKPNLVHEGVSYGVDVLRMIPHVLSNLLLVLFLLQGRR